MMMMDDDAYEVDKIWHWGKGKLLKYITHLPLHMVDF